MKHRLRENAVGHDSILADREPTDRAQRMVANAQSSIPFLQSWKDRLSLPERIPVSEWSDKYRVLSKRYSSEWGKWRTSHTPYLKEILDSFGDSSVNHITIRKAARCGGTESMYCMIGYAIDCAPVPMIILLDTEPAAKEEATGRIKHSLEANPRIRAHIPYTGWATGEGLYLDNCDIYMAWATSANTLTRRTAGNVFVDELDNCAKQEGRLGDTLRVVAERLTTFGRRGKLVDASSPTTPDAPASREYAKSDRRQYHVPCPKCGTYQVFRFSQIKVPADVRDPELIRHERIGWYECESCGAKLDDNDRTWMVDRGVWVSDSQTITEPLAIATSRLLDAARVFPEHASAQWRPAVSGDEPYTQHRGYHIWRIHTPQSWSKSGSMLSDIMAEHFASNASPALKRVFVTHWLGEPWEDVVESISSGRIRERASEGIAPAIIPDAGLILVGGIDLQKTCAYWILRVWGYDCESWLIAHGREDIDREAGEDEWTALERAYEKMSSKPFDYEGGTDRRLSPSLILVDEGYRTKTVYEFCRSHGCIESVKGQAKGDWGSFSVRRYVAASAPGKPQRRRRKHVLVDTSAAKEALYEWAGRAGTGPGTFHVHHMAMGDDDQYVKQFTSEHQVIEKGKPVWKTKGIGRANHYLDAEVYALAAAEQAKALTLIGDTKRTDQTASKHNKPKQQTRSQPRTGMRKRYYRLPKRRSMNRY